jgi:glycosyltransferase involved in cell wall biosynthesis
MRIGIVSGKIRFNDGQGRVNYEIAAEALRRGHELVLFCEQLDPKMAACAAVQPQLMVPPRWLPSRLFRDQLFAWLSQRRISGTRSTNDNSPAKSCDAILSNGFATWAGADVNAVHFVHSSWRKSPHHPWRKQRTLATLYKILYNNVNAVLEQGAFRRSPAIVAVSDKVRRELIEIGVPSSSITTIVNGVDADEFRPGPADRARFGLPEGPPIALFAGDLSDTRKNLETVLKGLAGVPGLHLAIAGRHEGTAWPRLAVELGVDDRVHFLGFRRDMPELMRAVNLFVFPSRYEACALVFLEALASGLPVVTARSAGGAELVTPQVGIVLDDSDDVATLSRAMLSLLASAEQRTAMGEAARTHALQYSWPVMASRYMTLLEAAAGQFALRNVVAGKPVAVR